MVELDRSLSMLRTTIESTADGLLVTDKSGKARVITSFIWICGPSHRSSWKLYAKPMVAQDFEAWLKTWKPAAGGTE